MDLACPKDVVSDYAPPELHWSISIPHPATLHSVGHNYELLPDELDEITTPEDEDDLDIPLDGTGNTE
jgi:hypothetical protein